MQHTFLIHTTNHRANQSIGRAIFTSLALLALVFAQACSTSTGSETPPIKPQSLPVLTLDEQGVTTYREYSASLEGSKDIEIRPQVDGQLTNIYVDEGDFVQKGQLLFKINGREYIEQLNTAKANLEVAKANLAYAHIEVAKLKPLVNNKVISEVQLQSALAAQLAAKASVSQAKSLMESAQISLGYTAIKAPADGYIGRIPFKTGSLANVSNPDPLTILSEIKNIFVYFALSENEYIQFKREFPGKTVAEKIEQLPPVELLLADGSLYPQKGKVELVSGQFNNSMGSISFRAVFPNNERMLRSGNTGIIRIPHSLSSVVLVPQKATYEIQDKIFVFTVGKNNKVVSKPISVSGKSGTNYLVESGLLPGDKVVYSGLTGLRDGVAINPMPFSLDSLKTLGSL